ncbi:preprotein translocase subunit SecE [Muricoccus radiodurans]|uniref:preprotein translocase subunit SecE n=1 Tax=Muricoccus radiodurans TaxID=2231721 RepID=UPI003CF3BC7E
MAEAEQHIDYVAVDAKDILAERQNGWAMFTRSATWGIVLIALLLIALKVLFG